MIAAIAIWLYISFLSISFGLMTKRLIENFFSLNSDSNIPFAMVFLVGLASITTLGNYLHLFMSIGLVVNLILIISSLVYLFLDKSYINEYLSKQIVKIKEVNIITVALGLVFVIFALYQTTSVTLSADTPLYHALSIRYIEEYAVIPGLGNLYHRLAFNNSWFVTNAIFNLSFLGVMQFNVLGTFLMIFSGFYFLSGINSILNRNYSIGAWVRLLFIPILFYSYYYPHLGYTSSPSPDIPSALFMWILLIAYVEKYFRDKSLKFDVENVILGLCATFLITVKLSVAPIIIPFIYVLLMALKDKQTSSVLKSSMFVLVFFLPWFAHNYYLAGYLVHPFPSVDLFDPEWKIPKEEAIKEKNSIQNWAKWPGWFQKPQVQNPTTKKMEAVKLGSLTYSQWFDIWLKNQTLPYYKKMFYAIPILWVLGILVLFVKRKKLLPGNFDLFVILLTMIVGYLYWFLSAPDLRFGWGIMFSNLFTFLVLILYPFFNVKLSEKNNGLLFSVIFSVFVLFSAYLYYDAINPRYGYFNKGFSSDRYLVPRNIEQVHGINYENLSGNEIYYAPNIYDSPLPSAHSKKEIRGVEMIGSSIEDGFKMKDEGGE